MLFDALILIGIGFIIGLSGAILPGPLFAFTVLDTSRKHSVTGHLIIFGHVVWESIIILIILLGFGTFLIGNKLIIYIIGGSVLLLMGYQMTKSRKEKIILKKSNMNSSFLGGIFYTAFNPTQPLWWATAGLSLLLKGMEIMSVLGVIFVTAGHWLADFVYYIFISFVVRKNENYIAGKQGKLSLILALFVSILGIYFIVSGLQQTFIVG